MTSQCQGHAAESARAEHMKEAERLADEYAKAVHDGRDNDCVTLRSALLAHIQRGAVPEHSKQDVRCGCCGYMTYHREHMGCIRAAAHAPDQFRDAQKMVTAQPRVETFDVDFLARLGAEVPAPAEVPMPECYVTSGGRDLFSEEQMSTYGTACRAAGEAAGYARGVAEGVARTGLTPAEVPMPEMEDLLDWVSACQSSYHIDNTPGHRFGGLGSNLEYNRAELVSAVQEMLLTYGDAREAAGYARGLAEADKLRGEVKP